MRWYGLCRLLITLCCGKIHTSLYELPLPAPSPFPVFTALSIYAPSRLISPYHPSLSLALSLSCYLSLSLSLLLPFSLSLCLASLAPPVLRGRDPAAVTVLLEDSAAITGVLLAASMLGLAQYTGNTLYDAMGSIGIGGTHTICIVSRTFACLCIYLIHRDFFSVADVFLTTLYTLYAWFCCDRFARICGTVFDTEEQQRTRRTVSADFSFCLPLLLLLLLLFTLLLFVGQVNSTRGSQRNYKSPGE